MHRMNEVLKKLEGNEQLRSIPEICEKEGNYIIIRGKKYINFASNDYLSVGTNSELFKEFLSINNSLPSAASARLLSGSSIEYTQLEKTLSRLFNKESALIFNTGYQCNLGVISTLAEKDDVIFSDKLNHASIIDGMKLSGANFFRYKHLDYEHLEKLLQDKRNSYSRAIIITESIFSMDGDIANIDKLIELKNKYNCLLMVDEAHAFCSYGDGLAGITYNKDVDIITATFGKALGSFGAFCVSNKTIINYLINKSRSFIFSTSIPPINIAWSNWLLTEKKDYLINQKNKLNMLCKKANTILNRLFVNTHILPIIIGSNEKTVMISEKLKAEGYYVPAIRPPTVPSGSARLRISLTAETNPNDIENLIKIVREF